ncbi:hypothetical protein L3X38_031697 [Prunus dulcis]|uniref:Uncharacterized protein n=1 Tax=Prunus dulcis TaxID=3755 RepID=A0AAD4VCN5_PRUDU|nr:hypothetical protein L3X38_031697 [Prunus dulcis]
MQGGKVMDDHIYKVLGSSMGRGLVGQNMEIENARYLGQSFNVMDGHARWLGGGQPIQAKSHRCKVLESNLEVDSAIWHACKACAPCDGEGAKACVGAPIPTVIVGDNEEHTVGKRDRIHAAWCWANYCSISSPMPMCPRRHPGPETSLENGEVHEQQVRQPRKLYVQGCIGFISCWSNTYKEVGPACDVKVRHASYHLPRDIGLIDGYGPREVMLVESLSTLYGQWWRGQLYRHGVRLTRIRFGLVSKALGIVSFPKRDCRAPATPNFTMSEEAPFRPREKLVEKQKFFQSVHKYTYLKGPYDKITSVAIPAALAASSLFLIPLIRNVIILSFVVSPHACSNMDVCFLSLILHFIITDNDSLVFLRATSQNCRSFLNLLDGYCTASGQQVNYSKSSIYLSPNASPELGAEIGVALRINPTTDPGVYLGIPAIRGRSKKEAVGYICDKIQKMVHGMVGKPVL